MVWAVLDNASPGRRPPKNVANVSLAQVVTLVVVGVNSTDPQRSDHCEILSFRRSRRQKLETDHLLVLVVLPIVARFGRTPPKQFCALRLRTPKLLR
jgi:hypothetical protein